MYNNDNLPVEQVIALNKELEKLEEFKKQKRILKNHWET